jgi:integrase
VLSVEEVRRLIDAVRTHHNRAYFWTVYSLGLRLGEGLHLQVGDIDSARMLVHVHRGKGAKDRYVPLPSSTLKILRQYWVTHRHPQWLFPATGRDRKQAALATGPMDKSSVQGAMRHVVQELGAHNEDGRITRTQLDFASRPVPLDGGGDQAGPRFYIRPEFLPRAGSNYDKSHRSRAPHPHPTPDGGDVIVRY